MKKQPPIKLKGDFVVHGHHTCGSPLEYLPDGIVSRQRYIKGFKPKHERKLRLHLLKLWPIEELPKRLIVLAQKYDAAYADDACAYAVVAAWDTLQSAILAHHKFIMVIHACICPNCPWDGISIFANGYAVPKRPKNNPRKLKGPKR